MKPPATPGRAAALTAAGLLALGLLNCGNSDDSSLPTVPVDPCTAMPRTSEAFPAELAVSLDRALEEGFDAARAPGVVAHVVLPDVGAWYGVRGVTDEQTQTPISSGARFRVGSITKTFTAAAVLQLVEEGRWQLTDPVDDHVGGYDFSPEVTLERLLDHTAGVYNYTDDAGFLRSAFEVATPGEVIDFALSHGEVHPPGSDYSYSNTGYYLLGLALERAENKPLEQILRQRMIAPHALTSAYMEQYEEGYCAPVQGHVAFSSSITEGFSMSWAWAAGGLVADVTDLCNWADTLLRGAVLSEEMLTRMKTENEHSTASERYGLGLRWLVRGGREVAGHTGSTMGFNGELFIDPSSGACVAIQTNDFLGKRKELSELFWGAIETAGY